MFGSSLNKDSRRELSIIRKLPPWVLHMYARHVLLRSVGPKHVEAASAKLSPPDIRYLEKPLAYESIIRYFKGRSS